MNKIHYNKTFIALTLGALLAACGGGGGGGSTTETAPTLTLASGGEKSVSSTFSGTTLQTVGSVTATNNATSIVGSITMDNSGNISALTIKHSNGTTETYNTSNGDKIFRYASGGETAIGAFNAAKTTAAALLVADESTIANTYKRSGSVFTAESRFAGNKTKALASSIISSATYNGYLIGTLQTSGTTPRYTTARVTMSANFTNKSIAFSTSDMALRNMQQAQYSTPIRVGGSVFVGSDYELTATLTDANGNNEYTGTVTDASGRIGTLDVNVMGANADEVAGTGSVTDNTTTNHTFAVWGER